MKLKDIVTTINTSKLLKSAGFNRKSIFSYFKNKNGHIYIAETDFDKDEFIAFSYTSAELIDSLPSTLEISTSTYIARSDRYETISEEEIEKYHFAELTCIKTFGGDNGNSDYLTKYSVGNSMIAFSQNTEGKYRNLLFFGDTEAESRAKMILALIEEEKM